LVLTVVACLVSACRTGSEHDTPASASSSGAAADSSVTAVDDTGQEGVSPVPFSLTSPAFEQGGAIPLRYSCDGEDLSPPLQWSDPPAGTGSFVLICDDPDAPIGTWVHWVVYNLPASSRELPEGIGSDGGFPDTGLHGRNSWKRADYGGPCPPSGTHRYFFHLYAVDSQLVLDQAATKEQVLREIAGHVLGEAELMGTFRR